MGDLGTYAIIAVAVLLGATVQGGIGLGIGLIGSPVAAMVDPSSMPGAMLIAAVVFPMFTLATEWRHVDLRGTGLVLTGRVLGTVAAVCFLTGLPARDLGIAVGTMVLLAVALSASTLHVVATRGTLLGAGVVSGMTSTTTSIGGPPLALVYQHAPGPRIRATLAACFCVGGALSLAALAVSGDLHRHEVLTGLGVIPFAIAGFALAAPLRRVLDNGWSKNVILGVVALSAVVLIVKNVI